MNRMQVQALLAAGCKPEQIHNAMFAYEFQSLHMKVDHVLHGARNDQTGIDMMTDTIARYAPAHHNMDAIPVKMR